MSAIYKSNIQYSGIPLPPSYIDPAGTIQMFAGSTAPDGWLFCNGAPVLKTDYPELYNAIGDTYGTPLDNNYFLLPDFRGRVGIGAGKGTADGATAHVLASAGGDERFAAHSHDNTIKATTPKFTHTVSSTNSNVNVIGGGSEAASLGKAGASGTTYPYKRLSVADHAATACTMSGSVSSAGSGTAGNMQPYLTINYIICTGRFARYHGEVKLSGVQDVTVNEQSIVYNGIADLKLNNLFSSPVVLNSGETFNSSTYSKTISFSEPADNFYFTRVALYNTNYSCGHCILTRDLLSKVNNSYVTSSHLFRVNTTNYYLNWLSSSSLSATFSLASAPNETLYLGVYGYIRVANNPS